MCMEAFQRLQNNIETCRTFVLMYIISFRPLLEVPLLKQFWARLYKTNDIVSKRDVKISNVNISNMPIFFVEKL